MLSELLTIVLLIFFQPCMGSPRFQEQYRGNYVPDVIETTYGLQVVAPDTPYVAASGRNKLYFIDIACDAETASHVKEQIERATVPNPEEYIAIDEFSATAEVKNSATGETTFVFDPPYARVLFAKGMNRHNPNLKLPEHEPAGDWEVAYDIGSPLLERRWVCSDYGCNDNGDCVQQTNGYCTVCNRYRIDNYCGVALTNAIGICQKTSAKAADTPREEGESDAKYYQRMDELNWA